MSDAVPVIIPASIVQGIQAPTPGAIQSAGSNNEPQSGIFAGQPASTTPLPTARANAQTQNANSVTHKPTATSQASVSALVQQLNKYLNDSGRPNQFRIAPLSRNQTIQEINPSNGEVIGEFAAVEFPALARSLGVSGVLVDSHA